MAVAVTHATVATLPDEVGAEINKDQWNEGHTVVGLGTAAEANVGDFDAAGAATTAVSTHEAAGDPHPQYLTAAEGNAAYDAIGSAAARAPADADYLVGTAQAGLSNEIVVGATPGGELGGTWASPTVDVSHSGSTHAAVQAAAEATAAGALSAHEAAANPHPGYLTPVEGDAAYAALAHATRHQSGGADSIKLDDLAAPDDNTDLNASTSAHGLLRKLDNSTSNFLRGDGAWAAPVASAGDFDCVLTSTSTIAANKARVLPELSIADGGGVLVIEDAGILAIV